jgi:mannosyltransferase OCH1-like enzyme
MNSYRENTDNPMNNNPAWELLEDNYNRYYLNYKGDRTPIIPKNIHLVWLGSPFPEKYERVKNSWVKYHPGWNIKIWNDADAESFGIMNKRLYDIVYNYGVKSDIFRYEILYRYGGIYIDTDIECFSPFDDLLYLDFFAGTGWNPWPVVFNGLMACAPGNDYLFDIINGIKVNQINLPSVLTSNNVLDITGCDYITSIYIKYLKTTTEKTVIFPNHYFFPIPATIRDTIREDNEESRKIVNSYIKPNTYCAHLWYCSWQK